MNMATKNNIWEEHAVQYWKANKQRRGEILDAVVLVSGITRKGAIKRFARMQRTPHFREERRGRPRTYTPDVIAALHDVWSLASEACGENLHPMIGEYIDTQIRVRAWHHDDLATGKLRAMSGGSVKAYVGNFERSRLSFGGKSTTTRSAAISMVPVRMDGWDTAETGVVQVDTVAHCGHTVAGDFGYTTNGTDVATLWGSRRAQWNKGQEATKDSLVCMRTDTPFPWTEMHPDSGTEFINLHCIEYAEGTGLRMTRSRPYKKNDNCFVEERNGHIVRAYVGYVRLDVIDAVEALNEVYDVLTPYLNHFIASRRIVSKQRVGARWQVKREKKAKTPYQRVLERTDVTDAVKESLRIEHATLDPKRMKMEIDRRVDRVHAVQRRYGTPRKRNSS